ncbi:dihydrodipicolinate synthase family protein [Paraburkholderia sprentiae WSM5005]|uniref:Dihydrodipicolinate synthase family protein n=1 Tax=Paraburkholderia sprentiae WSM5005 TaxID=754502 RepID=A0A1I9YKT2_9BURK|nr:dihydrodipicolinate synthase family protein [Paraburkholderia sprentiae]APA86915.1 dihydrodipicolinate synthase family protein [Paraburkholderia sprentiae WSM5005]
MRLTVEDIVGVLGIVPTPATPDAGRWDTKNSVNLDETEKMIKLVTAAGVDILMANGTFGEGATLTREEHLDFTKCIIETNGKSRPFFAGVTTMNTRDTIARGRELIELGADGLFVGRPMWLSVDQKDIVRYYRDIAEALPGVPLVVYDNPIAFKAKISPEAYKALAEIPEVVAAKHVGGPTLEPDMIAVGDKMRILPLAPEWYPVAIKHPELARACWTGGIACAPSPIVANSRAILAGDWERAKEITAKLKWAEAPMFPGGDLARFMDYSIQIGHLRFKAAGLIDPGPSRPPYLEVPQEYVAGAVECGERWAQLEREFQAQQ